MGHGASQVCGCHDGQSTVPALPPEDVDADGKVDDGPCSTATSGGDGSRPTDLSGDELASVSADDLPLDDSNDLANVIVSEAVAKATHLMQDYEVLEAEAVLAAALQQLEGNPQACEELRGAPIFASVLSRVAQYDAICSMMVNPDMKTLWESEDGKFELHQTQGAWFDYKMTLNLDAPLSECICTGEEVDLIPKAQPMVVGTPEKLGPCSKFFTVTLMKLSVIFFRVELLFEVLRVRNRQFGFLTESIRSNFPADGRHIPEKGRRSIRPWIYTANLWMPRGGGQPGTVLVQVCRVDCGMNVPQWVLNFVFRQLASTFMSDLKKSAARAQEAGSPWAQRIADDASGLYQDLRNIEAAAQQRRHVTAQTLPGNEVFDRPLRLLPEPGAR